jgi:hypothetical protein
LLALKIDKAIEQMGGKGSEIIAGAYCRGVRLAEFPGLPNIWPSQALAAIVPVTASRVNFAA